MKGPLSCVAMAVAIFCAANAKLQSQQTTNVPSKTRTTMQASEVVHSLYREVVVRHPIGIPDAAGMKVFAPYLSKGLLHRIDLALACAADWDRQYPDPNLKPEVAWLEVGLFSGDSEQALPRAFHIEKFQPEKDGSFRVYVRLIYGRPPNQWIWHVAPILLQEDGHFVVDDVIYLKDESRKVDSRLTEYLALGCDGPHWIGYVNK